MDYKVNYLPVRLPSKAPAVTSWKPYQTTYYPAAFQPLDPRGALCGHISGDLLAFDFDNGGEAFKPWCELIGETINKTYVESSPHGFHVLFRLPFTPPTNEKLARTAAGDVLIETRGEGGFIVVSPTPGYDPIVGDLEALPVLTESEVSDLFNAARRFDQYKPERKIQRANSSPTTTSTSSWIDDLRQGRRGFDWLSELLIANGWTEIRETADGVLFGHPEASDPRDNHAVLHFDGHLYCFGTGPKNAPFAGDETYSAADAIGLLLGLNTAGVKREYFKRFPTAIDNYHPTTETAATEEPELPSNVPTGSAANKALIKRVLKTIEEEYPRLNALRIAAVENAPRPQPFLALIPALSIVSGLSCHRLNLPRHQSLNLSFCVVAPSAGGKGKLLNLIENAFSQIKRCPIGDDESYRQDFRCHSAPLAKTAPQFIYDILDSPVSIFCADEFQDVLGRSRGGKYDPEIFQIYKEVSTKSHTTFRPSQSVNMRRALEERQKRGGFIEAENPAVGLFLGGTDAVFKNLSDNDLNDGLVRRILFFYNPILPKAQAQSATFLAVSSDTELTADLQEWIDRVQALPEFSVAVADASPQVLSYINRRQEENEDYVGQTADVPPLRLSFTEILQKLAIVLAFSRSTIGEEVEVSIGDLELADDLIEISCNDFLNGRKNARFEVPDFKKVEVAASDQLLETVRQHGGCRRKTLFKFFNERRALPVSDLLKIVDALIASGALTEDASGRLYVS